MSLIVTPMSLDAALQSLDPFNNAAARAHYLHTSLKRASARPSKQHATFNSHPRQSFCSSLAVLRFRP